MRARPQILIQQVKVESLGLIEASPERSQAHVWEILMPNERTNQVVELRSGKVFFAEPDGELLAQANAMMEQPYPIGD